MTEFTGKPNRLLHEKSLYLRKHAYNPIDWRPWGPEALAMAEREDKPLFVSIGYSSCHWCTVMEGEAFSDADIAEYMNAHYVPIKVDREERPDLDAIYMQAIQLMTQQGGWPLNIFLSPGDLIPFYGGTYYPVEPRYGRPGFLKVLQAVHDYYKRETDKLADHKSRILEALEATTRLVPREDLSATALEQAATQNRPLLSRRGNGPSFPMIPYARFALRMGRFGAWGELATDLKVRARERGEDLALGGIYDHAGGGFHRYTVDPEWTVPHFEKMLYDNGQIVEYLSDLWASGIHDAGYERAVVKTCEWLRREMTDARGYFYASQDADSEGEEGKFYVWEYAEFKLLDAAELAALERCFDISPRGNFEGKNVLRRRSNTELIPAARAALDKLFIVRSSRIPPVTDTKLIVAWNALMISGLARAGAVFAQPEYLACAAKAAEFILANQLIGSEFWRVNYDGEAAVPAKAEDYALMVKALIDLHQATQEETWLTAATQLQALMDERLWDIGTGGYFSATASPDLLIREKDFQDNSTPSANGTALTNLVRLFLLTDAPEYLHRAEQVIRQFAQLIDQAPSACPSLLEGYDWYLNQTLVATDRTRIEHLLQRYLPVVVFKVTDTSALALVCQGTRCLEPARTEGQLEQQLQSSLVRTGT